MMDLIEIYTIYVPVSLKHYASAYYIQLIILSLEPDRKTRLLMIEVRAQMYFCYRGAVMFRNHSGGRNEMLFNFCTDCVLLGLTQYTQPTCLHQSNGCLGVSSAYK